MTRSGTGAFQVKAGKRRGVAWQGCHDWTLPERGFTAYFQQWGVYETNVVDYTQSRQLCGSPVMVRSSWLFLLASIPGG